MMNSNSMNYTQFLLTKQTKDKENNNVYNNMTTKYRLAPFD